MPFRIVQESHPETLQEIYLAVESRMGEGRRLIEEGYDDAGIYLLGYVAEMSLKLAFARLDPRIPLQAPVEATLIRLQTLWRSLSFGGRLDLHDVAMLAFLLEYDYQQRRGRPYPANIQHGLTHTIRRLHSNWWVGSRYRARRATRREAEETVIDVEWLRDNHSSLWR